MNVKGRAHHAPGLSYWRGRSLRLLACSGRLDGFARLRGRLIRRSLRTVFTPLDTKASGARLAELGEFILAQALVLVGVKCDEALLISALGQPMPEAAQQTGKREGQKVGGMDFMSSSLT